MAPLVKSKSSILRTITGSDLRFSSIGKENSETSFSLILYMMKSMKNRTSWHNIQKIYGNALLL